MSTIIVAACSILLQLIAAGIAFRLIRFTGKRTAWSLISAAFLIMALRRIHSFYNALVGDPAVALDFENELLALVISFLLLIGITKIAPLFHSIIQASKKLQKSEALFSTVFNSSPVAIAITRLEDNQFINVNDAWQKLTGYTRREAIGYNWTDLNIWVDPTEREHLIRMVNVRGSIQGFEVKVRNKAGGIVVLLISVDLIKVDGKDLLLTMAQDITEQKRLEAQSVHTQRLESLGVLANGIAHELNNTLAPILLAVEIIGRKLNDPQSKQILESVNASALRGKDIVRKFLTFARYDNG